MKIKLTECNHSSALKPWGDGYGWETGYTTVTCLKCYRRLRYMGFTSGLVNDGCVPDTPPAPCEHTNKKSVSEEITRNMSYFDAMCQDCGVILRHPDIGRGWTEVIFNGYIIEEEDDI